MIPARVFPRSPDERRPALDPDMPPSAVGQAVAAVRQPPWAESDTFGVVALWNGTTPSCSEPLRRFDLDADPREVLNPWDDPAHAERRREMVEEILRWRTMTAMTPAPLPASAR